MTNGDLPLLGRLSAVPPREVWSHEARDFTPWLLNNVDVLSELLGRISRLMSRSTRSEASASTSWDAT